MSVGLFGDDTRGKLLRATASAVVQKGLHECTVQDILNAAGLSRRTFYKFFKSIEDALDELFEVSIDLLAGRIQMAAAGETDPVEKVVAAMDAYLELQQTGGPLIVALQTESLRPESKLAPRRARLLDTFTKLAMENTTEAMGKQVDPLLFRALLFAAEGMVNDIQQRGGFDDAARQRARRVFLTIVLRTLGVHDDRARLPLAPGAADDNHDD